MQAETINADNFSTIDFYDNYFKLCEFEGMSPEGCGVDSDFHDCAFRSIDWYWGLFNICSFVRCQFADCIFRGSSFADCLFVECTFTNCQFVKDNLGGECDFDHTVAYGCSLEGTVGFAAIMR